MLGAMDFVCPKLINIVNSNFNSNEYKLLFKENESLLRKFAQLTK